MVARLFRLVVVLVAGVASLGASCRTELSLLRPLNREAASGEELAIVRALLAIEVEGDAAARRYLRARGHDEPEVDRILAAAKAAGGK